MFDIGFWELVLIAVISLLAIGPEQLPGFVRDLGRWAGGLRRLIQDARNELSRGLNLDDGGELDRKLSGLDNLMKSAPDQQPGFRPAPLPRSEKQPAPPAPSPEQRDGD